MYNLIYNIILLILKQLNIKVKLYTKKWLKDYLTGINQKNRYDQIMLGHRVQPLLNARQKIDHLKSLELVQPLKNINN